MNKDLKVSEDLRAREDLRMNEDLRVLESRRRVEERLEALQNSFTAELGLLVPVRRAWRFGLMAAGAGIAIVLGIKGLKKLR